MDAKELGQFIARLRKENHITQLELARKINVTDKAVSRWERGLGFPDINTLEPLADALGISLIELMQTKINDENELISTEKAEELLLDTIRLSKVSNRLIKFGGFTILTIFVLVAIVSLSLLFTDKGSLDCTVISVICGLVAWGTPIWKMTISQKSQVAVSLVISFCSALIALLFQIINIAHDIYTSDVVAVIDTIGGLVVVVCIFIAISSFLNIFMLISSKRN